MIPDMILTNQLASWLWFICVNHGYDSRHDFNKPIGIMTMIQITVNQVMIPDMILTHQLTT